jgi:CRISPR/Cas system-associated endonuclease Cas1
MAKKKHPDPLRRRHLVEQGMDPARALQVAEAYLEDDRALEAVAFLVKAEARERLAALREQAVREGDAFLLREVSTALEEEADAATWRALAEAAQAAGKELYAAEASRQAARLED